MKIIWLPVILIFRINQLLAQDINSGARIASLANTGVALQDVWSMQANQAGISALKTPVASISYLSNYIGSEISTQSAIFVYPFKSQAFGFGVQSYGFSAYKENRFSFSYARNFNNLIFAALNFNIHQLEIHKYGNSASYSVEAGLQYKPTDKLIVGVHVSNLSKSTYDSQVNAELPFFLDFGSSCMFSDKVTYSIAIVLSDKREPDFRNGLEYKIGDQIALRGGISIKPFKHYAGVGYSWKSFMIDGALSSHPILGYSPNVSLGYVF